MRVTRRKLVSSDRPIPEKEDKETDSALLPRVFSQEYGIDYEETFAHMARLSSIRTLIFVSIARKWSLFQMDVKNVFLNGELSEEVYMKRTSMIGAGNSSDA